MKEITQKTISGFTLPILVYESYTEADTAAGKEGAALDECNRNLVYRGTLNDGRELVSQVVEKVTGVAREQVPVLRKVKEKGEDGVEREVERQAKDKDGNPLFQYALDDDDYVKLALAKSGKTVADIQPALDEAARNFEYRDDNDAVTAKGLQVDIRQRVRKAPQPKSLPAKFSDAAKKAIESGKVEQFAKDYKKLLGKELESTSDATVVGWALKEFIAERERRALESIAA